MNSQVYTYADKYLGERHAAQLSDIREREKAINEQFDTFRAELTIATETFINGGIAFIQSSLDNLFNWLPQRKAKQYFKDLAKELDRPFILAEEFRDQHYSYTQSKWVYSTGIDLTVPAIDRLKNAVAGLSLIAVPDTRENENAAVVTNHSERLWRFRFRGDEGREHFNNFAEFCRTNPIMRVTLKLPVK